MRRLTECFALAAIIFLFIACVNWDDKDQSCSFEWQCGPGKDGEKRYCIPYNANPDKFAWRLEIRKVCMKPREKYEYCGNDRHCSGSNKCIKGHCQ